MNKKRKAHKPQIISGDSIRNYEFRKQVQLYDQQLKQKFKFNDLTINREKLKEEIERQYALIGYKTSIDTSYKVTQSFREQIRSYFSAANKSREPFELFRLRDPKEIPNELRKPAKGIVQLPLQYHTSRTTTATEEIGESGFPVHKVIENLIRKKYPEYINIIADYCRPLGTTDATFADFNREQYSSAPVPEDRVKLIMPLIIKIFDAKKYQPIAFKNILFCNLPLNTGTGYYYRFNYEARAHARFTHPLLYRNKPTSKGYFINFHMLTTSSLIHYIKYYTVPFELKDEDLPTTEHKKNVLATKLNLWFNKHPTLLFMRSHISKVSARKVRPVYGVDDKLLTLEAMLTHPLLVQARSKDSAILHSFETLRGGMAYIDRLAQKYKTYFTLDFSRFDQTVPWEVANFYFTHFLPQLIIINKGNAPTVNKPGMPTKTGLELELKYHKYNNLLKFYHLWFRNMTFVTPDGYAYRRTNAGIPSGFYNTQEADSFVNLFIILDSLLEYGLTPDEIDTMKFFILGDDNIGMTQLDIAQLTQMLEFVQKYISERWHMTIKLDEKCVITDNRREIEILSYTNDFGMPRKQITKLCAQLIYPEHGFKLKHASMRAVGIAFASCGSDPQFYELCKDIYFQFLEYSEPATEESKQQMAKYLPGIFLTLDDPTFFMDLKTFPTLDEIRNEVRVWKGELPLEPKWDSSHFIYPPNHEIEDAITLAEYREQHGLPIDVPPILM